MHANCTAPDCLRACYWPPNTEVVVRLQSLPTLKELTDLTSRVLSIHHGYVDPGTTSRGIVDVTAGAVHNR